MDVKNCIFKCSFDNNILMEQTEGFEVPYDGKKLVYKLNRSMCGLKKNLVEIGMKCYTSIW